MNTSTIPSHFDPQTRESYWYQRWEDAKLFQSPAGESQQGRPKYTITIPPPNITGSLHLGHSLCYPLQDAFARFHRLIGYSVLVVPGQDHAGIATQSVVTKQLAAEGITPSQLGREKFLEKVWEWRDESGGEISKGFRLLGCGFDWSKSRFTLDENYVTAVLTTFIDWYNRGLIYRGKRIVNWDPKLKTSVSDIETERRTIQGKLYHIRYPYADGSGHLIVATTRPETMLGDVAIAVHPSDARYKDLLGKHLVLPLVGRHIPLIADNYPDPEFGTGAVKITPAHDPNDYEVGVRHSLEMISVIDEDAKICADGPYFGLDRYEARKKIVADLEAGGFLETIEDHQIPVLVSDRSKEVIEPLLSEQWFVRQTELAKPAMQAVRNGKIRFVPDRYEKVFLDWLENIRDWCISRQLWWGHRIPVYYTESGAHFAAHSWDEAQRMAGDEKIVRQDSDVLDTWFSSGLWPFAVLGWPQSEELLNERYPTSVLVTDRGILFLWVARMVMMGLDFCKEVPFRDVYIHATLLNEHKQRMSKSLGTGVNPEPIIQQFGADALRLTLFSQAGMNQEIIYSDKRLEDSRNYCNKIWNASKFALMHVGDAMPAEPSHFAPEDQWILSRLAETVAEAKKSYEGYDLMAASQILQQFFWSEFCDWYIEIIKPRLNDPAQADTCRWVLVTCLDAFLKMQHPIMPFITEEVYQYLPIEKPTEFLMQASWPSHLERFRNPEAEARVTRWFEIIRVLRSLRADLELDPRKQIPEAYFEGDLDGGEAVIQSQAWIGTLKPGKPSQQHISSMIEQVDLHISTDSIDRDKLIERNEKELQKLGVEYGKTSDRLKDPQFMDRAKPEVVEKMKAAEADLKLRIERIESRLKSLKG